MDIHSLGDTHVDPYGDSHRNPVGMGWEWEPWYEIMISNLWLSSFSSNLVI